MKKSLCSLLVFTLLFSICGCTKAEEKKPTTAKDASGLPEGFFKIDDKDSTATAKKSTGADPLAFLPETVATIGTDKITSADIRTELKPMLSMMQDSGQMDKIPPEIWKKQVSAMVNDIIAEKLLSKVAEANGYKPDTAKADEQFKKMLSQMPEGQGEAELAKQGISPEVAKAKIASILAIQKWIEEKVKPSVNVSEADAEKFYNDNKERFKKPETVRASHILIRPESPDPEKVKTMTDEEKKKSFDESKKKAEQKAQELLAQLKKGDDFAKLATENSACPSKKEGGDLGTFGRGEMAPEFEKAAFSLKPGELSDIVETRFGYHIIKLAEKNEASVVPFADVKNFIMENLKKQKIGEAIQGIIEAEKKNQKVEVFLK